MVDVELCQMCTLGCGAFLSLPHPLITHRPHSSRGPNNVARRVSHGRKSTTHIATADNMRADRTPWAVRQYTVEERVRLMGGENAVKICRLARFIARRAGNAAESERVIERRAQRKTYSIVHN